MSTYHEVIFEEVAGKYGNIGVISLNRPTALNALNHSMILAIHNQLQTWAISKSIKAVVIKAKEGRAFCAGGDLRAAYHSKQKDDPQLKFFFRDEYHLNRFIFHYPKPYIALLNGITMGGGAGISIHGSHRIATDQLIFSMPETGIGFFPDVGGTYFLPRLPSKLGYYLGLTGARLSADDSIALGIAQTKMVAEDFPHLIESLANEPFSENAHDSVTDIINRFKKPTINSELMSQQKTIDHCFGQNNIEAIIHALENSSEAICQESLSLLSKKSPTSLKVSLHAFQSTEQMDFDASMRQEYRLVCHFLKANDFFEGIRAILIDKDQKPKWRPDRLDQVTHKEVASYFAPLSEELV